MSGKPAFDPTALAGAGEALGHFAGSLPANQRAALRALLARAGQASPLVTLGQLPAAEILTAREVGIYEALCADLPVSREPAGRQGLTVVMKATRLCNLRCTYCHSWRTGPNQVMPFDVLARTTRAALQRADLGQVEFVWHGGEVTLLPPDFFRKALWLQEQWRRPAQIVRNSVQTNGTRLSPEWLAFLRQYDFGVGVSLDGPPEVHDRRRRDIGGRPTAARVRDGLTQLRAAGITQTGVLLVVDDDILDVGPQRLLDYLLDIGVDRVALLNVIPENAPPGTPAGGDYLPLPRYIDFLRELFRLWWPAHAHRIHIRELSTLIAQLQGGAPQICIFAGGCFGHYLTVEPAGEISACDKYIGDPAYHFGSIRRQDFASIRASPQLAAIRAANRAATARTRAACPWFSICHGGCPHDRYTGERRLPGYDGRCCGFAPLLAEMAAALGTPLPPWDQRAPPDPSPEVIGHDQSLQGEVS